MRRGHRPTLYELMPVNDESRHSRESSRDVPLRTVRVPLGILAVFGGVVVLLLVVSYGLGYYRGGRSALAKEAIDLRDTMERQARMATISEVDEPGGGSLVRDTPVPAAPVEGAPGAIESPDADPRTPGLNYYVIDHPSRTKAVELVEFCRRHGLEAHLTSTSKGRPKVFVLPGYAPGERTQERFVRLRALIQRVGVLWERRDPGPNSDFSTHYAEKYQPRRPSGT
ncbi:MAG: hypothetical protein VXY94_05110 [Planctomycetota bacterium]|nr:hypothetical protein [Planctomycetota bacterium]MEC8559437.1 hypothetical protein [Planctomycetota bacterium]MEC8734921.1 hypothetical protein [Planctomycetota bacterium]MEC8818728.1 hypothetical protein [Planctomycetota bacterium]MEC9157325.1 hypothetical protein [Planctomycetota bacterium]